MNAMPTVFDFLLWATGVGLYFCVVAVNLRNREFLRYMALNFYLLATAGSTIGEWLIFKQYGYASSQYSYFYYYSESFLSVLLYLVVCEFYSELMETNGAAKRVRMATIVVMAATALTAFSMVQSHKDHLNSRFVVELGRDLNFVGGLLTYILLVAVAKVPAPSRRWLQLVSAMGLYFFGLSVLYGIRLFHPEWQFTRKLLPLAGVLMVAAWAWTFAKVPGAEQILLPSSDGLQQNHAHG